MFILFMCNIHYSIKSCIRDKLGKKIDYPTKIWIKPICKNKLEDLISYCKFTKYFDENLSEISDEIYDRLKNEIIGLNNSKVQFFL